MLKGVAISKKIILTLVLLVGSIGLACADIIDIKSDAPTTYVVKKGDTLWDISTLFLDEPWLWPELWRNNVQIENPHLIYPGDTLRLRYEDGKPVIDIVRSKESVVLSPSKRVVNKPSPISVLPWSTLAPFIANDSIMSPEKYQALPTLLGDNAGSPRFTEQDYVLAYNVDDTKANYQVIRKTREVFDSKGNSLGLQVSHLSNADISNTLSNKRQIVRIKNTHLEARQGDRLMPNVVSSSSDLSLSPAATQVGEIVQNINGYVLIGTQDVVIVNLGNDQVSPGTVFGIYQQGPDVIFDKEPDYASKTSSLLDIISFKERIQQPAYKVGELVVIKTFENASYAWITKTETHLQGGELIAKP